MLIRSIGHSSNHSIDSAFIHSLIHSIHSTNTHSFLIQSLTHWKQYICSILQLRQQNRLQLSRICSKAADSIAQQISSHRILYASHRLSFSTIQHPAERALIHLEVILIRRTVLRRQRLIRQLLLTSLPNLSTSSCDSLSSCSNLGAMVSLSQPATPKISSTERNEAPITTVLIPFFL